MYLYQNNVSRKYCDVSTLHRKRHQTDVGWGQKEKNDTFINSPISIKNHYYNIQCLFQIYIRKQNVLRLNMKYSFKPFYS